MRTETKRTAQPLSAPASVPSEPQIAARAYELYVERGRSDGHDLEDWLRAERELTDQDGRIMA